MEKEMVSVIVPVYNVEKYLDKCVSSICSQTYADLEIILVDDGSTDNSGRICDIYAERDRRINVLHKSNGGLVSARKAGLEIAHGKYIGFVDGDDYLEPEMYAELLAAISRENADFVHSGFYMGHSHKVYGVKTCATIEINHTNVVAYLNKYKFDPMSGQKLSPSIWSKLYRRSLILEAYSKVPNENSYGEDVLSLCHCLLKCSRFCILNKAYYHYVVREGSICHGKCTEVIGNETKLYNALKDLLQMYGLLDQLRTHLDQSYLLAVKSCINNSDNSICTIYHYPSIEDFIGKKIIIYGAGVVGKDYYIQFRRDARCNVLAVADLHYARYRDEYEYMKLISPEEITGYSYDVIVIAVRSSRDVADIRERLAVLGVSREKIFWKKPEMLL